MKIKKSLILVMFFVLTICYTYSQSVEKYTNVYLYENKPLFSMNWEKVGKKDKLYVDTLNSLKVIKLKFEDANFLAYLGEDWSIHFLTFSNDTNVIASYRFIENQKNKKFFPNEMYLYKRSDGTEDIIAVFYEGEGPRARL
jgi:hypothetical protein